MKSFVLLLLTCVGISLATPPKQNTPRPQPALVFDQIMKLPQSIHSWRRKVDLGIAVFSLGRLVENVPLLSLRKLVEEIRDLQTLKRFFLLLCQVWMDQGSKDAFSQLLPFIGENIHHLDPLDFEFVMQGMEITGPRSGKVACLFLADTLLSSLATSANEQLHKEIMRLYFPRLKTLILKLESVFIERLENPNNRNLAHSSVHAMVSRHAANLIRAWEGQSVLPPVALPSKQQTPAPGATLALEHLVELYEIMNTSEDTSTRVEAEWLLRKHLARHFAQELKTTSRHNLGICLKLVLLCREKTAPPIRFSLPGRSEKRTKGRGGAAQ